MENFAGLDVSMEETHVCVMNRDGLIVHEEKVVTTPEAIAASLAKAPACCRAVFETGRMAPMLYHGLIARSVPLSASKAATLIWRSSRWRRIRLIAMMLAAWLIYHERASSRPYTLNLFRLTRFVP